TCAGLGEADERNGLRRSAQRRSLDIEQVDELLDGGAGGAEHLGEAIGGRPARTPLGGDALRRVEGGGVEPRAPGAARWRAPIGGGEGVDRGPDLAVVSMTVPGVRQRNLYPY